MSTGRQLDQPNNGQLCRRAPTSTLAAADLNRVWPGANIDGMRQMGTRHNQTIALAIGRRLGRAARTVEFHCLHRGRFVAVRNCLATFDATPNAGNCAITNRHSTWRNKTEHIDFELDKFNTLFIFVANPIDGQRNWPILIVAISTRRNERPNLIQLVHSNQMDRTTLKSLLNETNQHVANSFNEQTLKFAQSIKLLLSNLTNSSAGPAMQTDANNNVDFACCTDLDWPGSFIQLINSLATKQRLATNDNDHAARPNKSAPSTRSSSSISSLAIDDRDFELVALPIDANQIQRNQIASSSSASSTDEKQSVWLMDFFTNSNSNPFDLAYQTKSKLQTDGINDLECEQLKTNDENLHDKNIMNLMKFLCASKSEPAKLNSDNVSPMNRSKCKSLTASENLPRVQSTLKRCKTLPPLSKWKHLNRITMLDLDQLRQFDLKLDPGEKQTESIETKKDFDGEEDDQLQEDDELRVASDLSTQNNNDNNNSHQADHNQNEISQRDSTASYASSKAGQSQSESAAPSGANLDHEDPKRAKTSGKTDDGKYSMLQFALYNFREAIEKYSLESINGDAGKQSKAARASDNCNTLRSSLKLIESLRMGATAPATGQNSSSSGQSTISSTKTLMRIASAADHSDKQASAAPSDWTWRELAQMVKFTSAPLKRPLLKLGQDLPAGVRQDLERRAVDCFAAIMSYMGDQLTCLQPDSKSSSSKKHQQQVPDNEVECVYLILINCHNHVQLRDEIYCQLIKQTTNNRSPQPNSCLRGWRLFSLLAAYFDCSTDFKPYLLNYLEQNAFDKRRSYHSIALLCLQNLRKTFAYGGRKNVPSIEEIAALSAGRISKRQIYRLPGGTERVINTKSTTVVDDIIHEICSNMLMIQEPNEMLEFSLYCIADGDLYTMPLNRDEYILDITTELIKNHQQYFLIFCRSIWHYPLRLESKLYIEVTFNQIAPDYLEGLLLVLPNAGTSGTSSLPSRSKSTLKLPGKLVKELARLAALLHRASGTDYTPHKDEIKYLLPKPIVASIKQQVKADSAVKEALKTWVALVQDQWREMSSFDTLDAKAQFLDIIRHWPLFGSSFFAIKLIQRDFIQPKDFILALNNFGIQMLDTETHETHHRYSFNEVISTRKVRSEDGALYLDIKYGELMRWTIIRIQTDQAHEISRLVKRYIDIQLVATSRPNISCEA